MNPVWVAGLPGHSSAFSKSAQHLGNCLSTLSFQHRAGLRCREDPMRTLISNLNVIRDTRICGTLRNGFDRISTVLADLAGDLARAEFRMPPIMAGFPVTSVHGKPLYAFAGKKPEAHFGPDGVFAGHETDQTCPWQSRLIGQSQVSERPVSQRSSQPTAG